MISARKAKDLDATTFSATTLFTYSHTNTPLGQSEGAYYLSYFIIIGIVLITMLYILFVMHTDIGQEI